MTETNPNHYEELENAVTIENSDDKCIECGKRVYYYRSLFCKGHIRNFFEGDQGDKTSRKKRDKQSSLQG